MALRIPLAGRDAGGGPRQPVRLRRVGVGGAAAAADAARRSARRAPLHRRPRVPARAARRPTTPTIAAPATSSDDPRHDAQLRHRGRERSGRRSTRNANARRVGAALGLRPTAAARRARPRRRGPQRRTTLDMRSMNTALWQVGWGYFLANMVGARHRPDRRRDSTGRAVTSSSTCAAAGRFRALRCGRQPYGVLPVTSLDLWHRAPARSRSRADMLGCSDLLLEPARQRLAAAPGRRVARVGLRQIRPIPTPISPTSCAPTALQQLSRAQPCSAATTCSTCARSSARICRRTASSPTQDAARGRHPAASRHRVAPAARARDVRRAAAGRMTVAAGAGGRGVAVASARAELHRRAARRDAHRRPDRRAAGAGTRTVRARSLLQMLLRHALLRELADAAARIAARRTRCRPALTLLRDAELVDLVTGGAADARRGSASST